MQVFHDLLNLYSSVPLDRSIQVIVEFLQDDHVKSKKNKIKSNRHSTTPRIMFKSVLLSCQLLPISDL